MARKPRFTIPGVSQHVIQRGHNREPCFYSKEDYIKYCYTLHEVAQKNGAAIHAYILLTNHVHIQATPAHEYSITHMMQDLSRKYVRYVNKAYQRSGTLWGGRFKSSLIDSEAYLLTCMRYIEMNPVRAEMVQHPSEYRWSSYHANAVGKENILITPHPIYTSLEKTEKERQHAYRELFSNGLDKSDIHEIREALNQELVLGREDFKDKIQLITGRQTRAGTSGRPRIKEPVIPPLITEVKSRG